MERGSVQHGARLDDEMAEEVAPLTHGAPMENRAREDLEAEPPADGEPTPDSLIAEGPEDAGRGIGLSHDDIELRSEIARHLRPSAFPARRDALLIVADEEGASDAVLTLLSALPRELEFHQVSEVWRALGGEVEHRDEGQAATTAQRLEEPEQVAPAPAATAPVGEDLLEEAAPDTAFVAPAEPSRTAAEASGAQEAPGCNLVAFAAQVAAGAGAAAARRIRRALPFG